jgi:predicted protein tyrosine phosphatase
LKTGHKEVEMLKRVVFSSQGDAESATASPSWAVISITQPSDPAAALQEGWGAVLRMTFHDTDDADSILTVFSPEHAEELVRFVRAQATQMEGILVHCHAGISRSAAVAKFIADTYRLDFPEKYSAYNKLIYRRLNQVLWREAYGDDVEY